MTKTLWFYNPKVLFYNPKFLIWSSVATFWQRFSSGTEFFCRGEGVGTRIILPSEASGEINLSKNNFFLKIKGYVMEP